MGDARKAGDCVVRAADRNFLLDSVLGWTIDLPCNMYQLPPYDFALCLDLQLFLLHKIQRLSEMKRKYKEDPSDPY